LSLYGLGLRVCDLASRPLSGDEIFQFNNIAGPFKPFWQHLHYGDHTSFPGDYLLTYPFVRIFGLSKWGLAVPHLLMTVLGFYLLYRICRRVLTTPSAILITITLFAVNQNLVYHALEFRSYAGLPVLALGSFYSWDLVIKNYSDLERWQKIGIGIFLTFCAFFHAYGILILTLPLVFLLSDRAWKVSASVRNFIGTILVLGALLWGWYASASLFGLKWEGGYSIKDTFRYIPHPLTSPVGFFKGIVGNLVGCRPLYFLLLGPVLALIVPNRDKFKQLIFLTLLIVLPLFLILLVDIRTRYWFIQRQFIWIMPYFALWIGWSWDALFIYRRNPCQ